MMAWRSLPAIALALALTGCNAQQQPPTTAAPSAGAHVSCIDLTNVTSRYPQPPSSIVFEVPGGTNYRNDLESSCPGLERANGSTIIETESQGKQLCRDDTVRVYDPVEARATGSGSFAKCRLGNFTLVAAH